MLPSFLALDLSKIWSEEHSYQFFQLPEGQVAEAKGVDLIFDFPSRWWGGRVAGLVDKSNASVFGRLFLSKNENILELNHE